MRAAADAVLKVIGPSTSTVLRDMFQDQDIGKASPTIEIYSPLATADNETLDRGLPETVRRRWPNREPMKLLRTVSDDGTMTQLLLEELKLRRVDPAAGVRCSEGTTAADRRRPAARDLRRSGNRIALISEWDSFYSRALIESFKPQVAKDARLGDGEKNQREVVDQWILRFSYLRGLDGRLPEESASTDKTASTDAGKNSSRRSRSTSARWRNPTATPSSTTCAASPTTSPARTRPIDAMAKAASAPSACWASMPTTSCWCCRHSRAGCRTNCTFSTDLDARMLQRGQAQTTRNLILAAPYGLTLTRALQQDVPPFRDSLQSAVFISVLAALAPQIVRRQAGEVRLLQIGAALAGHL